ncbi:MAG TPA: FtsX-like permease family protein [Gemmataceae bacterium]|nr:FtsX-like permease family protein [Gemmataceae bacterium]
MRRLLEIANTGLAAVFLHPLRSLVSIVALVAVLLPYLVGLGLSKGVEAEAEASSRFGADLYVTGSRFGRPVPIPLSAVPMVRAIDGVTEVVPRIVGEVRLGKEHIHAVLVGMPADRLPAWSASIEGELPRGGVGPNRLVIGTALARKLNLKIGSRLLPFYHSRQGDRLSLVVGVFRPDAPLWQANLILTTFETAAQVFDQSDLATDLLVWCVPGSQTEVSSRIERGLALGEVQTRVTAREDLLMLLPRGLLHREGIFNLHFVLAFVVGILVLLVTSGLGLAERRREIGILKAMGWQTDEVLLRGAVEGLCLSWTGACIALLLAWVWLRVFNGWGVAGFFLAQSGAAIDFNVPFQLTPVPVLLAFVLSLVIVLSGTLGSLWRAAAVAPREAMR